MISDETRFTIATGCAARAGVVLGQGALAREDFKLALDAELTK